MNMQIYEVLFAHPDGRTSSGRFPADDRRNALRVARHVASQRGLRVVAGSVTVHVPDPASGSVLYEGDFLRLPSFERDTCALFAKSPSHAEALAARLASEQHLVFCPASIRLSRRDNLPVGRFLHLLNPPPGENMDLPLSLPPVGSRTADLARAYENSALRLVARLGWLTAEQLQYGLALSCETTARRVLTRLFDKGLLEVARPMGKAHAYCLSAVGARQLELAGVRGVSVIDPAKISRTVRHRLVANNAVLRAMRHDAVARVYFEHEVSAGLVAVPAIDKRPDGLYLLNSGDVAWVEVENSSRSTASWAALLEFLAKLFEPMTVCKLSTGQPVRMVVFLCEDPAAFKADLDKRLQWLTGSAAERAAVKQLGVQENGRRHHSVRQLAKGEPGYILARCEFLALGDFLKAHP